jgi:hypothetical protein
MTNKPKVNLVGKNSNVFNLIAICAAALKKANLPNEAKVFTKKCFAAESYDQALQIMMEYCDVN